MYTIPSFVRLIAEPKHVPYYAPALMPTPSRDAAHAMAVYEDTLRNRKRAAIAAVRPRPARRPRGEA